MQKADLFQLLKAEGPLAEEAEALMTYGRLVGSWEVKAKWFEGDEVAREAEGEWHFDWVLGGMGVQDVLFRRDVPAHEYGTTLRCYDVKENVWYITWMQPHGRDFNHLIAHREGDRIVQESLAADSGPPKRWIFCDITETSFRWLGEISPDDGKTWEREQEMLATRITE